MGLIDRALDWLDGRLTARREKRTTGGPQGDRRPNQPQELAARMAGQAPGWWASDHGEEAGHFSGWNYIAIHAAAKRGGMATASAFRRVVRSAAGQDRTKAATANPDAPAEHHEPLPHDHPVCRLLREPNPKQPWPQFVYQARQQLSLTGTCHLMPVPNQLGLPVEVWIIPTGLARPMPPTPALPEGAYWVTMVGQFGLTAGLGNLAGFMLDARALVSIRWPHALYPGDGQSPLDAGRLQVDVAEEIDRATLMGMRNGVRPDQVLSLDPGMQVSESELDRAEARIRQRRAGSDNAGGVMLLRGVTPHQLNRSPAELDYVQGRNQARDTVFALHQTAPAACGLPAGSYAEYFAALRQTTELADQPDLSLLAAGLEKAIARPYGADLGIAIVAKGADDPAVLDARQKVRLASRAYTVDEFRAAYGDGPYPDPEMGRQQVGAGVANSAPAPAPATPAPGPVADAAPAVGDEQTTGQKRPELQGQGPRRKAHPGWWRTKTRDDNDQEHDELGRFGSGGGSKKPDGAGARNDSGTWEDRRDAWESDRQQWLQSANAKVRESANQLTAIEQADVNHDLPAVAEVELDLSDGDGGLYTESGRQAARDQVERYIGEVSDLSGADKIAATMEAVGVPADDTSRVSRAVEKIRAFLQKKSEALRGKVERMLAAAEAYEQAELPDEPDDEPELPDEPPEPDEPVEPDDDATPEDAEAYREAMARYEREHAAWQKTHDQWSRECDRIEREHSRAVDVYQRKLDKKAALEDRAYRLCDDVSDAMDSLIADRQTQHAALTKLAEDVLDEHYQQTEEQHQENESEAESIRDEEFGEPDPNENDDENESVDEDAKHWQPSLNGTH